MACVNGNYDTVPANRNERTQYAEIRKEGNYYKTVVKRGPTGQFVSQKNFQNIEDAMENALYRTRGSGQYVRDLTGEYCAPPAEPANEGGFFDWLFPPPHEGAPHTMGEAPQYNFGGKEKPPAQDPMSGPIQYDREGRPMDIPMEKPRGNLFGGFLEMLFPPRLPEQEEEMLMREREREEADLSPEDPEEAARKLREEDVQKTDSRFEQAHGQITQEGERAWEEVRMKYLDFGGFNYSKEVEAVIEQHRIPEPVDCIVDVAPWSDEGWVDNCDTDGVWVRARQRPTTMTPPQFGGKPCPPYSEVPQSVEERPCDPVDCVVDVAPWGQWENDCANSGMMVRARQRPVSTTPPRFGGKPCPPYSELPPSVEEEPCPPPVDCEYSEWTDWGECEDGRQKRTREITQYALYGGQPCSRDEVLTEWRECAMPVEEEEPPVTDPEPEPEPEPTPIDCQLSSWSAWTECDRWNTQGIQRRTRYVQTQAQFGGNECVGPLEEERPCQPIDCVMGEWEEWEDCFQDADGTWTQRRKRRHRGPDYEWPYFLNGKGIWGGNSCDEFRDVEYRVCPNPPVEEPAQDSTPDTTSETPSPAEEPASGGGGGGQTTTSPAAITTETTQDEKTTTEEPEEESNALKIVGGLVVLSGVGYWAYQKYA